MKKKIFKITAIILFIILICMQIGSLYKANEQQHKINYEFMNNYFDELTEIAEWDGCDCLAHITCPLRHIKGRYKIDFDFNKVSDSLDRLLKAIIDNGKSLEVNTSGLRQPLGLTMPDEPIIRRYRELGGKYITIGSDSHTANEVGAGIEEAMKLIKNCGFDKLTFFVSREIIQIDI